MKKLTALLLALLMVLGCCAFAEGGEITLDFNEAFAQRIRSTGTAGEYILMGSLVNTYLDAFNAATVTVTVEGGVWESGHVIYDMPMGRFEN